MQTLQLRITLIMPGRICLGTATRHRSSMTLLEAVQIKRSSTKNSDDRPNYPFHSLPGTLEGSSFESIWASVLSPQHVADVSGWERDCIIHCTYDSNACAACMLASMEYLDQLDQTSSKAFSILALLSNRPPVKSSNASFNLCEVIGSALIAFSSSAPLLAR